MPNIEKQVIFFDIGGTLVMNAQNWIPGAKEVLEQMNDTGRWYRTASRFGRRGCGLAEDCRSTFN